MSKENFLKFANYIIKKVDWEEMEKDNMLESYCKGMDWFLGKFFDQKQLYLNEEDCKFLRMFVDRNMTFDEIEKYTTYLNPQMLMLKYMRFGLIRTFKEKTVTYYEITPFGKKMLFKYEDYFANVDW